VASEKAQEKNSLETIPGDSQETTAQTEATVEHEEDVEESRYMLLDYLFKFVESTKTPLNPVLSGYFAKLVIMLLNRK
jgi:hypothetical protein